ncbi:MAG: hypothetical protein LBD36_02445 [Holosporales bacterium]|nr:hypothetical protein [Holosporales bacterium]
MHCLEGSGTININNGTGLVINGKDDTSAYRCNVSIINNAKTGYLTITCDEGNQRGVFLDKPTTTIGTLNLERGLLFTGDARTTSIQCVTINTGQQSHLVIGSYQDGNGTITSTNINSGGWIHVGLDGGTGKLTSNGTLTQTDGVIEIGSKSCISDSNGVGIVDVNQLNVNGVININYLVNATTSFAAKILSGSGIINIYNGNTIRLTAGNGSHFKGMITDSEMTGTLYMTGRSSSLQQIALKEGSCVGSMIVDSSQCNFAHGSAGVPGYLTTKTCKVINNAVLRVGDNATSYGSLICDNIEVTGTMVVGAYAEGAERGARGKIVCHNTYTQYSGCTALGTDAVQYNPGFNGELEADVVNVIGGIFRVGNDKTGQCPYANFITRLLKIEHGTELHYNHSGTGNAQITVSEVFTCNGLFWGGIPTGVNIGGLEGNGEIRLDGDGFLKINDGFDCTYNGQIVNGIIEKNNGTIEKNGLNVQILAGSSSYNGGARINGGMLCGEIGFNGSLTINAGGTYRLAKNASGATGGLAKTLFGELTGDGTLDLVDGCLALSSSSTFNGEIVNSNEDYQKLVLQINDSVLFDAGTNVHTIKGSIYGAQGFARRTKITGFFPNCYYKGETGNGINVSRNVSFRGLQCSVCHLTGDGNLLLTYGHELVDYSVCRIYYYWDKGPIEPVFEGSITKRGAGRQILVASNTESAPVNVGEIRVEEGILAGVLPLNAPLYVGIGAKYQISCYNGSSNVSNVTSQIVAGLRGCGVVELAPIGKTQDILTINNSSTEEFAGDIVGNGLLRKTGSGNQIICGQIKNQCVDINCGQLTFASVIEGPKQININAGKLFVTGGLKNTVINLNNSQSILSFTTQSNMAININARVASATICSESDSKILSNLSVTAPISVNTNEYMLQIDGTLSGNANIEKIGTGTFTFGEIQALESTSLVRVLSGIVNMSNKANLGKHMALEVADNARVNMCSTQTLRSIAGLGAIDLHTSGLVLELNNQLTYAGALVGTNDRNVVQITGNAVLNGNALIEYHGYLEATNASKININGSTNDDLKLKIAKNATITMFGTRTLSSLYGQGMLLLNNSEHITLQSDKAQIFHGDIYGASVILSGSQTFHWSGKEHKTHTHGIVINDGATLVVDDGVILPQSESFHLVGGNSHLWVEGVQTIRCVSGNGVLHASSDMNLVLDGDVDFYGDIIGSKTITFTSANATKFKWHGDHVKSFRGQLITDGNVQIEYPQSILCSSVIVSGQANVLTADKTLDNTQLSENISLQGNTVTIADNDDAVFIGWINGPGTVRVDCKKTLTISNGMQLGSTAVTFDIVQGSVIVSQDAKFHNATINLVGNQSELVVTSSGNLVETTTIHTVTDTGVIRFNSAIETAASFVIDQSTCLQINDDVKLTGQMSGKGEIKKEGDGTLIVADSGARTWIVNCNTLEGTFNNDSTIIMNDNTAYVITADQTLARVQCNGFASRLVLNGHNLTLTGDSAYAGMFDQSGCIVVAEKLDIFGAERNCGLIHIIGRVNIIDKPQIIQLIGTGQISSNYNVTLDNTIDRDFAGNFVGSGDITKIGNGTYTLYGNYQGCTGNFYINEGVIKLTESTVLGNGDIYIGSSAMFVPFSEKNINGNVLLADGTLLTNTDMEIRANISLNTGVFQVNASKLTITSPINLNEDSRIVKNGNGVLVLCGDYTQPMTLFVTEGDVVVNDTLHSMARVKTDGICRFLKVQELSDLAGSGFVHVSESLTLRNDNPIIFDGYIIGEKRFVIADSTNVLMRNANWNNNFSGNISVESNAVIKFTSTQTLTQVEGSGCIDLGNNALTVNMNNDQNFFGTFDNVTKFIFDGAHTFRMAKNITCANSYVCSGSTFIAERAITFGSFIVDGTVKLNHTAIGESFGGIGIVYANVPLTLTSDSIHEFAGDIVGSNIVNLYGSGTLTWRGRKSFAGTINIANESFVVDEDVKLHNDVVISVASKFVINSDQQISDLTGNGYVDLNGRTLTISQEIDNGAHFTGDITSGMLLVSSKRPWLWGGNASDRGIKNFNGVLNIMAKSHVVLHDIVSFTSARLVCNGTLEADVPLTIGALNGAGILKYANGCTLTVDSDFSGNIYGASPLTIHGGNFSWSGQEKSSSGLVVHDGAVFTAIGKLDVSDNIVINENGIVVCGSSQDFSYLSGAGTLNANGNVIALMQNIVFDGFVINAESVNINGNVAIAQLSNVQTLRILSNAALLLYQSIDTLQCVILESVTSSLTLSDYNCDCHELAGCGVIACHGKTFTLTGNTTSEFRGNITDGALCLVNEHCLALRGIGPKSLIGLIALNDNSTLEVDKMISLDQREIISVAPNAILKLYGIKTIGKISGSGSVSFDELIIQHHEDFSFEGSFISDHKLTFRSPIIEARRSKITLAGNSQKFTGDIYCISQLIEMCDSCRFSNSCLVLSNESEIILHNNSILPQKSTIIASGANQITLTAKQMTLSQTIYVQSNSELIFNIDDTCTLSGNLLGSSKVIKTGVGTLELAHRNDFSGIYDVQNGCISFNQQMTSEFDLHIKQDAFAIVTSDITLRSLSGGGSLNIDSNSMVTLIAEQNNTLCTTIINGGCLEIKATQSTLSNNQIVSILSEIAPHKMKVGENVIVNVSHINDNTEADVLGKLCCTEDQTFSKLNVSGCVESSANLAILGAVTDSLLSGSIYANTLTFASETAILHLLGDIHLQSLDIRGVVSSADSLSSVVSVNVREDGELIGFGEIQHLHCYGSIVPRGNKNDKDSIYGLLQVNTANINAGSTLHVSLENVCERMINGSLNIKDSVTGLENLSVVLESTRIDKITNGTFVLMSLPSNIVLEKIPQIDFDRGFCSLLENPRESITLTQIDCYLALQTGELH